MKRLKIIPGHIARSLILFVMEILGLVVVPVALLFTKDLHHLPHLFWPWCNEWDGINGRANNGHWVKRWGDRIYDFWPRFLWLAIRNRASNMSQLLGKADPEDWETFRADIPIPFTSKMFKCRWGYTSYLPGEGHAGLRTMPKHNFTTSISIRERS